MAFTKKNEEAVSPVIGVILMVAITVILAAVIAAFVFGMAGNISKTKVVAFTVQKDSTNLIRITNMGGQDSGSLKFATITSSPGGTCYDMGSMTCTTAIGVGTTTNCTSSGLYSGRTQITVVGTFLDETSQVLIDTTV